MRGATTTMKAMLDGAVVVGETWPGEEAVLEKKGGEEAITKQQTEELCSHLKQTDR